MRLESPHLQVKFLAGFDNVFFLSFAVVMTAFSCTCQLSCPNKRKNDSCMPHPRHSARTEWKWRGYQTRRTRAAVHGSAQEGTDSPATQ